MKEYAVDTSPNWSITVDKNYFINNTKSHLIKNISYLKGSKIYKIISSLESQQLLRLIVMYTWLNRKEWSFHTYEYSQHKKFTYDLSFKYSDQHVIMMKKLLEKESVPSLAISTENLSISALSNIQLCMWCHSVKILHSRWKSNISL